MSRRERGDPARTGEGRLEAEAARVFAPGGVFVAATPNEFSVVARAF